MITSVRQTLNIAEIYTRIYLIIQQVMVMGLQLYRCIAKKVLREKGKYFPLKYVHHKKKKKIRKNI